MICFADKKDISGIVTLWNEAFGDGAEEINKFLDLYIDCVLLYKQDDTVCGMLSLMPVEMNGEMGRYIYAVATLKSHRSKGISTELIEYSKEYIKNQNEKFCVLVPANEGLFDFYEKRGFRKLNCIEKAEYKTDITMEETTKTEIISAEEYKSARKKFLKSKNVVEWSAENLEKICSLYSGNFYRVKNLNAVYFGFINEGELIIKELCCENSDESSVIKEIAQNSGYKSVKVVHEGNKPFAMIYPEIENTYFNIALD